MPDSKGGCFTYPDLHPATLVLLTEIAVLTDSATAV